MELVGGIDEAGRGALAGPVVSSTVILPENHSISDLNDSKLLSPSKRNLLFEKITEKAISIGIGFSNEKEIDSMNILNATFLSMQRSIGCGSVKPDKVLVDGHPLPNQIIPNEGIINGDSFVQSIQAASIIAKVTRDKYMMKMDKIFPEFNFSKHKGYGTKFHIEMIRQFKATPIHRKSFTPVRTNLPSINWYKNNRRIGWIGERLSALFLMKKKHNIIELNSNCLPHGEIDIISQKDNVIIFSEVKTSLSGRTTILENQIDDQKMSKLHNAVQFYLQKNSLDSDIRLDAILVKLNKGTHHINRIKGLTLE